jgi:2-polyprenyl-3-methyl-5-hydroxy-6-metoxy-1,4-benzoquinol methylase
MSDNNGQLAFSLGNLPLGYPVDINMTEDPWSAELALHIEYEHLSVQSKANIPSEELDRENFYSSDVSQETLKHYSEIVDRVKKIFGNDTNKTILEIGCGDGALLNLFRDAGFSVIGVEPCVHNQKDYGYTVYKQYFDHNVVEEIKNDRGLVDCIIFNHVVELVPDIDAFFQCLAQVASDKCHLLFESPYFGSFIKNMRIDGFAHIICNWLTFNRVSYLCKKTDFGILDLNLLSDFRGGTMSVLAQKASKTHEYSQEVERTLKDERESLAPENIAAFRSKIKEIKRSAFSTIRQLQSEGMHIIGYGGGIKASSLANFLELTVQDIPFTLDMDPYKQGKKIPLAGIPILDPEVKIAELSDSVAVLIFALDHKQEITKYLCAHLPLGSKIIDVFQTEKYTEVLKGMELLNKYER